MFFSQSRLLIFKKKKRKYWFVQELSCSPVHVYPIAKGLVSRKGLVGSWSLWLMSSGSSFFARSADFSRTGGIQSIPFTTKGRCTLLHGEILLGQVCFHLEVNGHLDLFPSEMRMAAAVLYFLKIGFIIRTTVFVSHESQNEGQTAFIQFSFGPYHVKKILKKIS